MVLEVRVPVLLGSYVHRLVMMELPGSLPPPTESDNGRSVMVPFPVKGVQLEGLRARPGRCDRAPRSTDLLPRSARQRSRGPEAMAARHGARRPGVR